MQDDGFEWDDAKAAANGSKHGVSSEMARAAFCDRFGIDEEDHRFDYGEDCYRRIAMVDNGVIVVCCSLRGERIRIITARLGAPFEVWQYPDEEQ